MHIVVDRSENRMGQGQRHICHSLIDLVHDNHVRCDWMDLRCTFHCLCITSTPALNA